MNDLDHSAARSFVASIATMTQPVERNKNTGGYVTKVDADGVIWVRFDGASSATPCTRSSVAAKPGDRVSVVTHGNRGIVEGNYTHPATDDSKADAALDRGSAAQRTADLANLLAVEAISDAYAAKSAAGSAEADATRAASAAESAGLSALAASASADSAASDAGLAASSAQSAADDAASANESANAALTQLGTVEDVMGTLSWIHDHEVYVPATEFTAGETYYALVDGKYAKVDSPVASDVDSYYVYDHQATMAGFVQEHLTLTERGLYITQSKPVRYEPTDADYSGNEGNIRPHGCGYLLLSPDGGTEIYDALGVCVAKYDDGVVLGGGEYTMSLTVGEVSIRRTRQVIAEEGDDEHEEGEAYTVTDVLFATGIGDDGKARLEIGNASAWFGEDGSMSVADDMFNVRSNGDTFIDNEKFRLKLDGDGFNFGYFSTVLYPADPGTELPEHPGKAFRSLLRVGWEDNIGYGLWFGGNKFHVTANGTALFGNPFGTAENLMVESLSGVRYLADGTDLDECVNPGAYSFNDESTLANAPFEHDFRLVVSKLTGGTNCVLQIAIDNGGREKRRVRSIADDGAYKWSDWTVIFDGQSTVPIANGGTGATDAPSALESLGAASEDHEHDADDIKTGTLPVARGGTGKTALVGTASLMRDMFDANLTSAGYIPVFTANWADGGYMTPQNLRNKMGLGNTTGALPVANGGTGAASAADACKNLGVLKTETSGSWKIYTIAGSLKVQCFYATASFTGGNTRVRFSRLNFPKAYASAPVVSATLKSDSNSVVELSCHAKVHEVGSGYVEVAACSGPLDLASPISFKVFVIAIGV